MCGRLGSYSCSRHCAPSACRTSLSTSTLQRQADTSAPCARNRRNPIGTVWPRPLHGNRRHPPCAAIMPPACAPGSSCRILTPPTSRGALVEDAVRTEQADAGQDAAKQAAGEAFIAKWQGVVRDLTEQLDAHRKRQQEAHSGLTLTGMYNALEKLRSGEELTAKERTIREQGLVAVLCQLHDELDEAVLNAYGWSDLIDTLRIAHGMAPSSDGTTREDAKRTFDETILERLVALNAERAAEEARGQAHWLRLEFQYPEAEREPERGGLAKLNDDKHYLTGAGKAAGGEFRVSPRFGPYFL